MCASQKFQEVFRRVSRRFRRLQKNYGGFIGTLVSFTVVSGLLRAVSRRGNAFQSGPGGFEGMTGFKRFSYEP